RLYELTVWHDLRSPLAVMRSTLDLLAMGIPGPLTANQKDLLERGRRQAVRMADLIATTLDLEKLRQRKLQLDLQEADLFAAVTSTFQNLAAQATSSSVTLELHAGERPAVAEDRLLCRLDPLHAQRCVDNLVKNAIEASPRGEAVRVTIEPRGAMARLSVRNGGAPIPPHVRATLFHPFGTYGKRGGTGLGLYGVKLLAEAMGGAVACDTGELGTRFDLDLPLANRSTNQSVA
ncbi:MAG: HAMP domain-containing histidine kinase, partial [Deltaproteobacteria bacterium]|nr:HAMP domain-containing histidine kinase [Deltaproteobacteria bacterium]